MLRLLGSAAFLLCLTSPGFSNSGVVASTFVKLCLDKGFAPGMGRAPLLFPTAQGLDPDAVLGSLPADLPLAVNESWLLNPLVPEIHQLILAWGTFDHPSMGAMDACVLLTPDANATHVTDALILSGVEEDGSFLVYESMWQIWLIRVGGSTDPWGGKVAIIGMSPREMPTD